MTSFRIRRVHVRRDDFAGFQRRAVVNGDDADLVDDLNRGAAFLRFFLRRTRADVHSLGADDDWLEAVHVAQKHLPFLTLGDFFVADRSGVHAVFGNDDEEREIDRIDAFAQNRALAATLPALIQECRRILKRVALNCFSERLDWRQGAAVAGVDVADAAFGNLHERLLVDAELPREVSEMQPAAQHQRLIAGLAIDGDDAAAL